MSNILVKRAGSTIIDSFIGINQEFYEQLKDNKGDVYCVNICSNKKTARGKLSINMISFKEFVNARNN